MILFEWLGEWKDMITKRPWNGCLYPVDNFLGNPDECRLRMNHRGFHRPRYKRKPAEFWYRWMKGHWCFHSRWKNYPDSGIRVSLMTPWEMIDTGMRKMRFCKVCGRTEFS